MKLTPHIEPDGATISTAEREAINFWAGRKRYYISSGAGYVDTCYATDAELAAILEKRGGEPWAHAIEMKPGETARDITIRESKRIYG